MRSVDHPTAMTSDDGAVQVARRLGVAAAARVVGRHAELAWLERVVIDEAAPVVFVHGLGGIGKTTLVEAFAARLEARGMAVVRHDGQAIEPTPDGFTRALGPSLPRSDDALAVVVIDEYDALRLLDAWLRQVFVPSLPASCRLVLVGRSRPVAAWATRGWDVLARTLELGALTDTDALALLERLAVPDGARAAVRRIAAGHPLALELAATALRARPELPVSEIESRHVVSELVARFLDDVPDAAREAVRAASMSRRTNAALLRALLGDEAGDAALAALARLPFVEHGRDGLAVHQIVRTRVERSLRALDPARHRELRARVWRALRDELAVVSRVDRWRVTADLLYLVEHPEIREAFFPSDVIRYGVEAATAADRQSILTIAETHLEPDDARAVTAWWTHQPSAFQVVRDDLGTPIAFCLLALAHVLPEAVFAADPVVDAWREHARRARPDDTRPVLFIRTLLSARLGHGHCEERACCYLDAKRLYLQHLDLRAVYIVERAEAAAMYTRIGFERLGGLLPSARHAPVAVASACLPLERGVLAWLDGLVDAQHAAQPDEPTRRAFMLDRGTRQLVVDGSVKPLTRLEYGVLDHLERRMGLVASRDELLDAVWGQAHTGSNVVDAIVRTLRKKLGPHAHAIETVTGFGYKLRASGP